MASAPSEPRKRGREETVGQTPNKMARPGTVEKAELTRLLVDALQRLGHTNLAHQLEEESGVPLHSPAAAALREGVLRGNWDGACDALATLLEGSPADAAPSLFLLRRSQLTEALLRLDVPTALTVLRSRLACLGAPQAATSAAAALLLLGPNSSPAGGAWREELAAASAVADVAAHPKLARAVADTPRPPCSEEEDDDSAVQRARAATLTLLCRLLRGGLLVPEGRLETLLEQALQSQTQRCRHHNSPSPHLSLLSDHACPPQLLPSVCTSVLSAPHSDEVWHLAWSCNGRMLASGGKDGLVVVWQMDSSFRLQLFHTLQGHTDAVAFLAWAPDGRRLVSCSADRTARLWELSSGECLRCIRRHTDTVSAAAWLPCSTRFYTGGMDKRLLLWEAGEAEEPGEGVAPETPLQELFEWRLPRINDLHLSADGRLLVALCAEQRVRLWWPTEGGEPGEGIERYLLPPAPLRADNAVTSLCLSRDATALLLSMQSQELQVWDLASVLRGGDGPGPGIPSSPAFPALPAQRLRGPCQRTGRYVVRATLGGLDEGFVASGSEDSQVYLWRRAGGELLRVLPGHAGVVNAVAWNPAFPQMLASASDDATVCIWVGEGE